MFDKIRSDFRAVLEMDPAATSKLEVLLTYAGFHAIVMHRIAHWFLRMGMPFFARCISQLARFLTGIEIHPAAKIGGNFFIDHGMGVVIGETTEIGEHVVLFQGVTLGGTGKQRGKRHPTLGNHVVIGTGAKVLGAITIGDHVKVGANSVVLKSVPPHSTVVGVPGRVVRQHGEKTIEMEMLDHAHMPDPLNETLVNMQKQISRLEQRLAQAAPAEAPAAARKGEARRRAPKPAKQVMAGTSPVILPAETVQERQARMARMEKEERMKANAIRKAREAAAAAAGQAESEATAGTEASKPKKRVRRRRRVRKEGGTPREAAGGGGPGPEAGSGGGEAAAQASGGDPQDAAE